MCGIAGCIDTARESGEAGLRELAGRMADSMLHRGPDGGGAWADAAAGVGLGHRRLAIIDLSADGAQPMHSACGRYVVTYNGEIYNFLQLRAELEAEGCAFKSTSDTEVLLAMVRRHGVHEALRRMVGMFAFGLWDREEQRLYLARDRMGEKPLYYGRCGKAFVFGSELKALRAHPAFDAQVDREALGLYFRWGYIPAPHSVYAGIRKLEPGCVLTVDARDGSFGPAEPYWSMAEAALAGARQPFDGDMVETADALEALLAEVVRGQEISDVPLGAFLSGGIDSSLVVAMLCRYGSGPVKTFTIGFEDKDFNEAEHARAVAEHLGTEHTEMYASARDALGVIPGLPLMYDEPFADSSQIPTFLVSKLTREHVTVCLSADAGDEFFGGYGTYFWVKRLWERTGALPGVLRGCFKLFKALPPGAWNMLMAHGERSPLGHRLHFLADVLAQRSPEAMFRRLTTHWVEAEALVKGARPTPAARMAAGMPDLPDYFSRLQYLDAVGYLPGDILVKVDRAAMAVSLESRAPLLDHRVVEFAWSLPLARKVAGLRGKLPLRAVLERYVPREMIERPKQGFAVPLAAWLRGPLRAWAEELLDAPRLEREGYLDAPLVRRVWAEHLSGKRDWKNQIWDVLMFQAWLEENAG